MAKYEIPGLTEAKQFLVYLTNPKELAALLERLEAMQADLDAKITALGTLQEAEGRKAQAESLLAESRGVRQRAAEETAATQAQVETLRQEAQRELAAAREQATLIVQNAQTSVRMAQQRQQELELALEQARHAQGEMQAKSAALEAATTEAMALRQKLEGKLAQLQAVAQG